MCKQLSPRLNSNKEKNTTALHNMGAHLGSQREKKEIPIHCPSIIILVLKKRPQCI